MPFLLILLQMIAQPISPVEQWVFEGEPVVRAQRARQIAAINAKIERAEAFLREAKRMLAQIDNEPPVIDDPPDDPPPGRGRRLAFINDGNYHDRDDIGAAAMMQALVWKAGIQSTLVYHGYGSHRGATSSSQHQEMVLSSTGNLGGYGIERNVLHDEAMDPHGSAAALAREIDASHPRSILTIIQAGPWESMADAFDLADRSKHQYVKILSHSNWNDTHEHSQGDRDRGDFFGQYTDGTKPPGYERINDQNGFAFKSNDWEWLDENSDTRFVLNRTNASGNARGDMSDAGMVFYYLTGNESPSMDDIREFFGSLPDDNVVDDPPVDDPPDDPPVDDPPNSRWERGPDYAGVPFRANLPEFTQYRIPTRDDCDWIIEDGMAVSTRGLATVAGAHLVSPAYRASVASGHDGPVTFGVFDDAGFIEIATGGRWSDRSIIVENPNGGFSPVSIEFVGLDDSCEVGMNWGSKWGSTDYVGLYNIGLRGTDNSFVIHGKDSIGKLVMDGCWWLAHESYAQTGGRHASGIHLDNCGSLVWRRHKWRGVQPDDPGINLREHSGYFKSLLGPAWIVENNLNGGGRTGFQIRPARDDGDPRPAGPLVISHNTAISYGWNTPGDGGSCITVWANPDYPTFFIRNTVVDAKYGAMTLTGQGNSRNHNNGNGFPISEAWFFENVLENSRGDRDVLSVSAVEVVRFFENDFRGRPWLNNKFAMDVHGIRNGRVYFYWEPLARVNWWTYDGGPRALTQDEKDAMVATYQR